MLSKRTVTCLSFFQTAPAEKEKTEAAAIAKIENLIKAHNQALVSKKCELFAMKADMADARVQARLKTPGLFASTASETQQSYRDLEAQIEKQECVRTLLQVDLKKLRNEEIDEELQEKAEKYMQIERGNLVSIFQFA
jgi:hypothetical protein